MLSAPAREREVAQEGSHSQALSSLRIGFEEVCLTRSNRGWSSEGGRRAGVSGVSGASAILWCLWCLCDPMVSLVSLVSLVPLRFSGVSGVPGVPGVSEILASLATRAGLCRTLGPRPCAPARPRACAATPLRAPTPGGASEAYLFKPDSQGT